MSRKPSSKNGSPLYWSAETWAFISLRLFLSLLFLTAGLGKFKIGDPDGAYSFSNYYDGFCSWIIASFEETGIPSFLVSFFAYSIGYAEIILGLLLVVGVKTKWVLALFSLTLVSLAFGQMVIGDHAKVNEIGLYLLFTTAALYFVRHNKLEALR